MKYRLLTALGIAGILVSVESTAEFSSRLSDISSMAILLLGPVYSVVAGVIGGLHRRPPSAFEVFAVAYIAVIFAALGTALDANEMSDQALTNAIVATVGLSLIEPVVCVATGLGVYRLVRMWSDPPLRDEPGGREVRRAPR